MDIRTAKLSDAQRVWEIRNDPKARANSANSDVIPLSQHIAWFEGKYFGGKENLCFIGECGESVIGYCRFDLDKDAYVVSIAIDPAIHGKGFGTYLLRKSIQYLNTAKPLLATVKKNNLASIKLFERNNFRLSGEDAENFFYEL